MERSYISYNTDDSRETANKGPAVYTNLSGTWNLTSNDAVNKTLGQIRFGSNNRFTGTFDGNRESVGGSYTVLNHTANPFANLTLNYIYHNHAVKTDSSLNVTDKDDMKMMDISVHNPYHIPTVGSDYKVTTGLYLHPGIIIYFTRAQPIQFANSLVGHWTFYNQTSAAVTATLSHVFTTKQRNMTDIFNPLGLDLNIQKQ